MTRDRLYQWAVLIPILLAFGFNLNVLGNGFGWNDEARIISAKSQSLDWDFFYSEFGIQEYNTTSFRPLVGLSLHVDSGLWGDLGPGYHLISWLAHILSTVLFFYLIKGFIEQSNSGRRFLPLALSSVFAVHPALSESVAWIGGRSDLLSSVFILASLLFYRGAHQRQSGFFLVLSLCSFLAALLASEAALFLSGMFFLLYRFSDKTFAPRFVQTLGVASVLVAYFGIRWLATGRIVEPGFPEIWTKGFWEWVSAAGFLIKLTVFPYPQQIFLSSIPVTFAHAVWGLLGVVFLLGAFMLALKKKEVLMGFGAGWTLLFLIPAVFSIIIAPDGTGRPVERAGYLMSFGVLMLAGSVLAVIVDKGSRLPGRLPVLRAALTGFMLSVLVVFWGVDSWGRNLTWLNSYSFWSAAESAAPQSGHPRRELGKLFARADVPEKAGPLFVKAVEADEKRLGENHPELAESLYELGRFYAAQKKYTEAEPLFVRALTIKEEWGFSHTLRTASLLYDLAELYRLTHAPLETEEFYQTSLRIREEKLGSGHPDVAMVLKGLGGLYHTQERYSEAEKLYGRAINIQTQVYGKEHPFTGFTRYNLAKVYHAMKRYDEAENLYKELLPGLERLFFAENPLVIETLENLASIYEIKKQDEKLEEVYGKLYDIREKTLEGSDPNLKIIYEKYSDVLLRNAKEEEARELAARYNALNKSG